MADVHPGRDAPPASAEPVVAVGRARDDQPGTQRLRGDAGSVVVSDFNEGPAAERPGRWTDKLMWVPDKTKLLKVRLQDRGEDVETPWAEDLGPLNSPHSGRLVRLGNVPFLHAKPTYGDVIAVTPDPSDGVLTWDAGGVAFEDIGARIEQDEGRWVVIIDYWPRSPNDNLDTVFKALDMAGEKIDIAVEGAFVRREGQTARAYLAVPASMALQDVMDWLRTDVSLLEFSLVHPVDDS